MSLNLEFDSSLGHALFLMLAGDAMGDAGDARTRTGPEVSFCGSRLSKFGSGPFIEENSRQDTQLMDWAWV